MKPGDRQEVAGYHFKLEKMEAFQGPNYQARRAVVTVNASDDGGYVMKPEQRLYPVRKQNTTEAAIRTTFLGDVYVTLGEVQKDGVVLRISFRSLIPWLWMGALLLVLGGLLSLSDRRVRVAAPAAGKRT